MKKADWNLWIRSKYTGRKRKDGIDMEETIFRQELQKRTTAIEDLLKQYLPAEEGYQKTVIEAMNYSLMAGGKRLRPMLMQETYRMLGGEDDIIEPFMAAIEMIHTYSLVHDDLPAMDNDEYRRGRKTTWSVYGDGMGVLAGDGLLNYAFETAFRAFPAYAAGKTVDENYPRVAAALNILARKAGIYGMIGGQNADIEAEEQTTPLTTEQILFIHANKTAALNPVSNDHRCHTGRSHGRGDRSSGAVCLQCRHRISDPGRYSGCDRRQQGAWQSHRQRCTES